MQTAACSVAAKVAETVAWTAVELVGGMAVSRAEQLAHWLVEKSAASWAAMKVEMKGMLNNLGSPEGPQKGLAIQLDLDLHCIQ